MVGIHHLNIQSKTMNPLVISLSGVRKGLWGTEGYGGVDLTNVHCKLFQTCQNEYTVYNEYILIKTKFF